MGIQTRGGIARCRNFSVDATGYRVRLAENNQLTQAVKIRCATNPVRLFFTEEDFDNDTNFWEVGTSDTFELGIEDRAIWMKGNGGDSAVTLLTTLRKG